MRVLNQEDINFISGGSQTYIATTMGLGIISMAIIYSLIPKRCEDVVVYTDVITPLYDAQGRHYANKIDTYEEIKQVCQ